MLTCYARSALTTPSYMIIYITDIESLSMFLRRKAETMTDFKRIPPVRQVVLTEGMNRF